MNYFKVAYDSYLTMTTFEIILCFRFWFVDDRERCCCGYVIYRGHIVSQNISQ